MVSLYKRFIFLLAGLFLVGFGVALTVKGMLGTSPIASVPFIFSLQYPITIGMCMALLNIVFIAIQILILKKSFKCVQLLQLAAAFVFGCFIDLSMYLLQGLVPEAYAIKIVVLLLGIVILAFGVALEIIANIVMIPSDSVVKVIANHWNIQFGRVKTAFDISMVIIASVFSWIYFQHIYGVREGTLMAAIITGTIANVFTAKLINILASKYAALKLES